MSLTMEISLRPNDHNLLADATGLVGIISQTTPCVTFFGTLSKRSWQSRPEVGDVDVVEPAGVCHIGINDFLWVDEEVLGCARDTGILARKRSDEDCRYAMVVELPVDGALWADSALVQPDLGVDRQVW